MAQSARLERETEDATGDEAASLDAAAGATWWKAAAEVGLIVLLFFIVAGGPPPDVNEAHYLAKARHYWNPEWCAEDQFLNSSDAHAVFYWTFGWLTILLPLPTVAWLGRVVTWVLLAWSWRRLSWSLVPRDGAAVLTAGVFLPLQIWGNMAGEWVVGGVEAKGIAYVLVFLGLEALVVNRWPRMFLCFGAAAAFHVLVGGWAVVAGGFACAFAGPDRPPWKKLLPGLAVGGLLSLPGLLPAVAQNLGQDPAVVASANRIYVIERLAHHLVFWRFAPLRIASFLAMTVAWGVLVWFTWSDVRQRRLHRFVLGTLALAACGVALSAASGFDLGLAVLRFYWFRLADAAVPLGFALAWGGLLLKLRTLERTRLAAYALLGSLAVIVIFLVHQSWMHQNDPRPAAERQTRPRRSLPAEFVRGESSDWQRACDWIREQTPPDAVFITPRAQQTFHWYAGRGEVACWKNVPQDAASLCDWWTRMNQLYPLEVLHDGLSQHGERGLKELGERYGAQYVVLDRRRNQRRLDLPKIYPNQTDFNASFAVYRLPEDRTEQEATGAAALDGER